MRDRDLSTPKREASHIPHPMTPEWAERADRIIALTLGPRKMALRAATTVVDAAMFGVGCLEGTVRKRIQEEKDADAK